MFRYIHKACGFGNQNMMNLRNNNLFKPLVKGMVLFIILFNMVSAAPINAYAQDSTSVSLSVEDTAENVIAVSSLAGRLGSADFATRTGGFSWDTEGKSRSWTYYNGIMMDAFLMLDSNTYISKVDSFYNANIGTTRITKRSVM